MNAWFSDTLPVMTVVLHYLNAKDVARWRQVANKPFRDTTRFAPDWPGYVQENYMVEPCSQCVAVRSALKTEWCDLCEGWVCEDHLERCRTCGSVFCDRCVFHCCG